MLYTSRTHSLLSTGMGNIGSVFIRYTWLAPSLSWFVYLYPGAHKSLNKPGYNFNLSPSQWFQILYFNYMCHEIKSAMTAEYMTLNKHLRYERN